MIQMKITGKCYLDFAFKFSSTEYIVSADLGRWALYKKGEEPGTGYSYVQILCFRFGKLKRELFDKWVDELLNQIVPEAERPGAVKKSSQREDIM